MSHNRRNAVVGINIKKIRKILKHNNVSYIVLNSLLGQFNRVQNFISFLNSWRDSAFLISYARISQSFAHRFKTVSLRYLHDLIIRLSKQLFFLKSYEWSLNLKISIIVSGAALHFTLNISVNSTELSIEL